VRRALFVTAAALALAACSTPDVGEAPDSDCGAELAWVDGVSVRSNGQKQGSGESCSPPYNAPAWRDFGPRWQCVELLSRYFHGVHGVPIPFDADASELCAVAKVRMSGWVRVHAGDDYAPRHGDAVVLDRPPFGHAAIVDAVDRDDVVVFEQNASRTGTNRYPLAQARCFIAPRRAGGG
jgi:hypothetical protein